MKKNQYLLIFIFLILVSIILICSHNSSRIRGCSCEVEYTTQHKTSDTAGGTLLPLVDTSPQYLSESPVTLELFFKNSTIPKKIYQTYKSKSSVPQKVFENIKKYATEYDYEFFSDEDCIAFIEKYFPANVLTAYNKLENRAHKADLFRYCILYINGGIYLDIKTVLLKPLKDIFKENYVYSSISSIKDSIYQGVLASPPKNKFFLELIDYIVVTRVISYYLIFTRDFYTQILKNINSDIKPGLNTGKQNFYLFKEECTRDFNDCPDGLDRYGKCCFIYDNKEKIFQVRYSDFPWN